MKESSSRNKPSAAKASTKWAMICLALIVGYAALQPALNERFGWHLPSLSSLATDNAKAPAIAEDSDAASDQVQASEAINQNDNNLKYGYLREVGQEEFESPAGLNYTRGSAEGHRLKHLERHLQDQPDRPGKHGVFTAEMPQVLSWLDDTYQRAESNGTGTNRRQEDQRTVYEAEFDMQVGYVGGREGKQQGNPPASSIRLVTEGTRVITAFPY